MARFIDENGWATTGRENDLLLALLSRAALRKVYIVGTLPRGYRGCVNE